jgi:hypothetical protein
METKIILLSIMFFWSVAAIKAQAPKLCNVQGVLVQRVEPEPTLQINQETKDRFGYDANYFKPMAAIIVEAKRNNDGKVIRTKTDKDGNYIFKDLADGVYVISPILPKDYEKAEYYATIAGKDCIQSKDIFEVHTVGNLKGRIENLPLRPETASIGLSPVGSAKIYSNHQNGLYIRDLLNSTNCKSSRKSGVIEFDCSGLPTGKYYLNFAWRYSGGAIYYPGVGSEEIRRGKKPEIIEIKTGQTTDASFKVS